MMHQRIRSESRVFENSSRRKVPTVMKNTPEVEIHSQLRKNHTPLAAMPKMPVSV